MQAQPVEQQPCTDPDEARIERERNFAIDSMGEDDTDGNDVDPAVND